MKPNSLSASAVDAFTTCPARWVAESHNRMGSGSPAADLGTACHGALEDWVSNEQHLAPDATKNFNVLRKMFEVHYVDLFKTDDSMFDDGVDMLKDWHKRNHPWPEGLTVVSTEKKDHFMLKTSIGDVPFNYIWDRCDMLDNGDIDVVDYKTIRFALNADQMKTNIQVRSYALAAAIQFADHDYKRIWVTLDMLRHGDPVSVSFTRDENKATWDFLHDVAEQVIAMDPNDPPERVNSKCRFCVRKTVCKTLAKYTGVGSVASFPTVDELIDKRAELDYASKGIKAAIDELDREILELAEEEDTLDFESASTRALVRSRRRRTIDADLVRREVPREVWDDYGGAKLNLGDFDKMLEDPRIDNKTKRELELMVQVNLSAPFVITESLNDFD